jgi:hypothetical protein
MTKEELEQIIANAVDAAVEQKLLEILGDPDEDLEIRRSVKQRLLRQKRLVAAGERGRAFEDVARELNLE